MLTLPVQRPPLDLVSGRRGEANPCFVPFELCRERHTFVDPKADV